MLPLLKVVSDRSEHKKRDVIETLAVEFKLTDDERKEMLASGQQSFFDNRVGWAATYLKKAGLIDSPKRATFTITQQGLDVLKQNPTRVDAKYLRQFPSFIEFQTINRTSNGIEEVATEQSQQTPEEVLDAAYTSIRKSLASDLIKKVLELSPTFFERLVVELLVKMGYGGSLKDAGRAIGTSGDEGIDGIIKEDKLGLDVIYIQAKRWQQESTVGRPEIQKFVGALAGQRAKKGVFITTSRYSSDAKAYAAQMDVKIVLIDGDQLAQLMIDYNIGVALQQTYEVKKIDSDYFGED